MKKSTLAVILGTVSVSLLTTAALVATFRERPAPAVRTFVAPSASSPLRDEALLARVATLEQRLALVEASLAKCFEIRNAAVDGDSKPSLSPTVPPQTEETLRLDAAFSSEPEEPSERVVLRAESQVKAALPRGSELADVECRGPLCRVETTHRGVESYQAYVDALNRDNDRAGAPVYAPVIEPADRERGEVVSVAYLNRD